VVALQRQMQTTVDEVLASPAPIGSTLT